MQAPAMPNGGEPGGCSSQMVLPCLPRPMIATLAVAAAGNLLGGAAAVVGRSECAMADIRRCAAVLPSILMVGVLAAPPAAGRRLGVPDMQSNAQQAGPVPMGGWWVGVGEL